MQYYQTKAGKIAGANFKEVYKTARYIYEAIRKKGKRNPHIRSPYFKNQKIFLQFFWGHLFAKKNWKDRLRRIQYFKAAIELVQSGKTAPESKENPNNTKEIYHRFSGITCEKEIFCVQIKEDKKSGKKYLISVFPKE